MSGASAPARPSVGAVLFAAVLVALGLVLLLVGLLSDAGLGPLVASVAASAAAGGVIVLGQRRARR